MQIPVVLRNKWIQMASVAVVAFASGSVGGYILGKRKVTDQVYNTLDVTQNQKMSLFDQYNTETKYPEEVEGPINVTPFPEEELLAIRPDPPFDIVKSMTDDQLRKIIRLIPEPDTEVIEIEEVTQPQIHNVFAGNGDDDWDYEAELSTRNGNEPYILHIDEFVANDMGFNQETVTYYAGDLIMADQADTVIYDPQQLMGELRFGYGSRDPNIVYIRNEKIHMEWEVLLHSGTFTEEVLGLQAEKELEEEIRHSSNVMKFRRD